jgi:hypothetical protein
MCRDIRDYIGHDSQLAGVEEYRLTGGKGDGMRIFQVWNGRGLEFTVAADRCADISRLKFRGVNMGYFSPNGYVAPSYYDDRGDGFLKSFTAGFLTTCGLTAVGSPCVDEGECLPLHGTIGNTPAEHICWERDGSQIRIHARIPDERIFGNKLVMDRVIVCSLEDNVIWIEDEITNRGDRPCPLMILYHMNVGYPLLTERARLTILSEQVRGRNDHAQRELKHWDRITKPQEMFEEQCYYHTFDKEGAASVYNPEIGQGLEIRFDAEKLPCFTQWKMMGKRDYVLGLEPGNCYPDGRDQVRRAGKLKVLGPDERAYYKVQVRMTEEER